MKLALITPIVFRKITNQFLRDPLRKETFLIFHSAQLQSTKVAKLGFDYTEGKTFSVKPSKTSDRSSRSVTQENLQLNQMKHTQKSTEKFFLQH